ncbi:chloramphenicol phosphotransferase CPT family protein [Bacillus sp. AK031]
MKNNLIIVLNGVSSSGKSALAKELTKLLPDFFAFSIDNYDYVIEQMEERESQRLIPIETEYFYYKNAAMFSDRGVNLILDQVLHDSLTAENFYEILKGYPVLLVGVHCPAQELKRREQQRGDRQIDQALSQLNFVHQSEIYDVEVNTFRQSLADCAQSIVNRLNSDTPLTGFHQSLTIFKEPQKAL